MTNVQRFIHATQVGATNEAQKIWDSLTPQDQESARQQLLIGHWGVAHANLVAAKEAESVLRFEVANNVFKFNPDGDQKGTKRHNLPGGWAAKITFKQNETLEQDRVEEAKKELKAQGLDKETIAELFPIKYSVADKVYKSLTPAQKDAVDSIRSYKAGTPQLELCSPKKGK